MAKRKDIYMGNTSLPTSKAQFEYTEHELSELAKCKQDLLYFAESYFYIRKLDEKRGTIKLRDYQRRVMTKMRDNRFFILLSPRQSGKTSLLTIYALWEACFKEDYQVTIVANKEATAIEIFKRVRLAYEELPNWLKPGVEEYGKTGMKLANGSSVGISTTTGSAVRGQSINLLLLDELAFVEPASILDDFWRSVYPTISSSKTAKIFISSTPNGTGNLFHRLWTGAINNENGFAYDSINWYDIPDRDEVWKEKTIKDLGSYESFLQEYQNVFLEHGDGAIDFDYLEKLIEKCEEPIQVYEEGRYKVWELYKPGDIYVAGIDVAEGVGKDYSVINVLNITNLQHITQVGLYACNKVAPYEFAVKCKEVLAAWNNPLALIERNGPGGQIIDKLVEDFHYPLMVNWGNDIARRKARMSGIISHTNTKHTGITNMRYWVNELKVIDFKDVGTVNEFKNFTRKANSAWGAKDGCHDDKVMSLVWALAVLLEDIVTQYFTVVDRDDYGRPKTLEPIDGRTSRQNIPSSEFYSNRISQSPALTLPVMFGDDTAGDTEMMDLESLGWTIF